MQKRDQFLNRILNIIPEINKGLKKSIIITIIYEAIKLIPIILIKLLVDSVVNESSTLSLISWIIGGIIAVYLFENIMDYFSDIWGHKQMLLYETIILKKAEKKLLNLHMGYHEQHNPGSLVSRVNKGAAKLTELIWFFFNEFLPTIVQLILTFFLLIYVQYIIAIVFIIFSIFIFIITNSTAKKVQPYRKIYLKKHEEAVLYP